MSEQENLSSRRDLLSQLGNGFGMIGLASLLARTHAAGSSGLMAGADKPPHFQPKAKNVILLFMNGGMSQVDTFDPKPSLAKYDGQPYPGEKLPTESKTGNLMRSPFEFKKFGESGIEVSEIFPNVARLIDDVCVVRSMHTNFPNHAVALLMFNCGHQLTGRPSMGSWITYGLGSENKNLPGFVVMCPGKPILGPPLWGSGFLPAATQGTFIPNNEREMSRLIPNIRSARPELTEQQDEKRALLRDLNERHSQSLGHEPPLEGAIESMELAFRMQLEAPTAFNIDEESEGMQAKYGDGDFARGCLIARRLVERGVRIVQVYFGDRQPWDNHSDILVHRELAAQADTPIAALITDLKERGLLDETLVIVGTEFGRTPVVQIGGGPELARRGRDHNAHGFSMLFAGGGVKGGSVYGRTDEFGFKVIENPVHVHDLQATILHLLGIDHKRLTYRYSGRDFRLTDVHGEVVRGIIA